MILFFRALRDTFYHCTNMSKINRTPLLLESWQLTPEKESVIDKPYEVGKNLQKIVEIVFYDPAEYDTNYHNDVKPIECTTIGWLVEQNSFMVSISWLREEKDEPYVGLAIPMGCVKSIQELKN